MAKVIYDHATRIYPKATTPAVDNLDLEVADGECLVLVGPSGCGKSTSLRMLAGLEDVDQGSVRIGERDVTTLPPKDRDIAMVFQNYALYPHMSVAKNMGFALRIAGVKRTEIDSRVLDAARILDLEDYLDRRPSQLSGGQRQRVAMGRAIVRQPQVFLMDEPLSNLDAKLRVSTRTQIASLQRRLGVTTIYVTHDQVEAMTMGDRVALLKDGVLQQCESPRQLYERPANVFVAGFIGSPPMNLIPAEAIEGGILLAGTSVPIAPGLDIGKKVIAGVRPEALIPVGSTEGSAMVVQVIEELGSDAYVYGSFTGSGNKNGVHASDVIVRVESRKAPQMGETLHVTFPSEEIHLFDAETGERLN